MTFARASGVERDARQFYAQLLSNSLRHDEAIAEIERARAIDPLAPITHTFAMMCGWADRNDAAVAAVRHALTLDPDPFPAHAVLGHLCDRTGNTDAALESYRNAYRLSGGTLTCPTDRSTLRRFPLLIIWRTRRSP